MDFEDLWKIMSGKYLKRLNKIDKVNNFYGKNVEENGVAEIKLYENC